MHRIKSLVSVIIKTYTVGSDSTWIEHWEKEYRMNKASRTIAALQYWFKEEMFGLP